MHLIQARNVHWALGTAVRDLIDFGQDRDSRNGPVRLIPGPVTTTYEKPSERVLFFPWRDANPFFHLIEALWMVYGSNELKHLTPIVKNMANFSDDGGVTQHGAYGYRWRKWFKAAKGASHQRDQLAWAINKLKANPDDRRVAIQMYDASVDQAYADEQGKDVPCNLMMLPSIVNGALDLTVFNRSNDIIWGCYGANAVHFSFIQELMAECIGVPVGKYYQVSNNFHGYHSTMPQEDGKLVDHTWPVGWTTDPYSEGSVEVQPMFGPMEDADLASITTDLGLFFEEDINAPDINWSFLNKIARPMLNAHRHYKKNRGRERYEGALEILRQMPDKNDWRRAGEEWIQRRYNKWAAAADDGVNHEASS